MSGVFKMLGLLVMLGAAVEPANILGVFTSNSPSHQIIHMSYVRSLVERGHNVTVVTTTPLKDKNPGYKHIHIPQTEARSQAIAKQMQSLKDSKSDTIWQYLHVAATSLKAIGPVQYDAIKSERFQEIMNNPGNKFDLVFVGYFFSDYLVGLGEHFKCPVVLSWTSHSNELLDRYVGNPPEISYVPGILAMQKPDPMTFLGRLEFFYGRVLSWYWRYIMDAHISELYKDLFPPSKYPSLEEVTKRISLVFVNSHLSETGARPLAPAVIEVGGIQIKEKPDPLPENLQKIVNSSKDGVIYLSFGSNVGSRELGPKVIYDLYKVMSSLKETVLWKWDDSPKPGNAKNIHFLKWLPQDDLLAQKNVKLFITHAGKGGVAESQFHGVPMLAIPIFADQPGNAKKLTQDGFGLQLDKNTMTEESIREAVLEILQNPKYTQNVRKFSQLYRDRPMSPRQTAMFWIEYVLRHKGAYHMQSPAIHLNVFQYLSLDVIGFLLLVAFIVFKVVAVSAKFVFRKVCCRSGVKVEKSKKH
ncbi:UDP-glycosyltransferase UGT5-like [Eupeodes corollae]|uniref:UDP-glycosyltransferase UGT5-like n=1 Tax=Eupeodes corollae TaxID=290404 RepID=UPI0024930CBD|nr:UDP-glycosyltransferase UGT5-like [Eupeodes corollae]